MTGTLTVFIAEVKGVTGEGGIGNVKEESKYMMDETLENGCQEERSSE